MNLNEIQLLPQNPPDSEDTDVVAAEPGWILKKLTAKHKNVAALLAQGVDRMLIGQACGCTPQYVTMLAKQPLFIEYIKGLSDFVDARLEALYSRTADVISEELSGSDPDSRLKAARLQLEVTGRVGKSRPPIGQNDNEADRLERLSHRLIDLLHVRQTPDQPKSDERIIDVTPESSQTD